MKLSEFLWWPKEWTKDDMFNSHNKVPWTASPPSWFLVACKLTRQGLLLELDHYGETVIARVAQPNINGPGNMVGLRDFFLKQIGESISSIEELEVQPHQSS